MNRLILIVALVLLGLLAALLPAFAEQDLAPRSVEIETARGVKLKAMYHAAQSPNGAAVVIAPGQGYHMELPLITTSAARLADEGFAVLRFDWAFFTAKGAPAADFATEVADLDAAIAWVHALDGVDKVVVAGKSIGSLVAMKRAGSKHDDLAGVALLTFPIHNPGAHEQLWVTPDDIDNVGRPMSVFVGDRDPLCDLGTLYALIAKTKTPAPIIVVPGEHSFRDPDNKNDKARTAANIDVIVNALVLYCGRWIE